MTQSCRITKTTICGTDLQILKGDVATCAPGRILGHEGVGVIESGGPGVTTFQPGDRRPDFLHHRLRQMRLLPPRDVFSLHDGRLDSRQSASMERRPSMFAFPMPTRASIRSRRAPTKRRLVMLSDILPTGFECGVLNGKVEPGQYSRPSSAPVRSALPRC